MSLSSLRALGTLLLSAAVLLFASALAQAAGLPPVKQLVAQKGEIPGYSPDGSVQVIRTVAAWTKGDSDAKADAQELKRYGFSIAAYQPQKGPDAASGTSSVVVLKSAAAAGAWRTIWAESLVSTLPGGVSPTTFAAPGVPGSTGASFPAGGSNRAGNLFWTEGRCAFVVGQYRATHGYSDKPLVSAAQAIYKRTRSMC